MCKAKAPEHVTVIASEACIVHPVSDTSCLSSCLLPKSTCTCGPSAAELLENSGRPCRKLHGLPDAKALRLIGHLHKGVVWGMLRRTGMEDSAWIHQTLRWRV